jgi:predicted O-linked N-acetylglucosamine transferase (SPINDLY family)
MTMSSLSPVETQPVWQEANHAFLEGQYDRAATLYEQAIEQDPEHYAHYWYLGLIYLLQGQESEAQSTWLFALSAIEPDHADLEIAQLHQILQAAAEQQEASANYETAWLIRQHLRELCPDDLNNLLHLVGLSIELQRLTPEIFEELIPHLHSQQSANPALLIHTVECVLHQLPPSRLLVDFVEACTQKLGDPEPLKWTLLHAGIRAAYTCLQPQLASQLAELYLQAYPDDVEFLGHLAAFCQNGKEYDRSIKVAKRRYDVASSLPEKVFSTMMWLRGLLGAGGYWTEALKIAQQQEQLLQELVEHPPSKLESGAFRRLLNAAYYLVYLKDQPKQWRVVQNRLLQICQDELQRDAAEEGKHFSHAKRNRTKPLKIGYLSHCLATHSVGWLARGLIFHHDRDRFQLHGYFLNYRDLSDPLKIWYTDQFDHVRKFDSLESHSEIASQIYQDEIDILIDLDSITLDLTCAVLALKPAPIQVTWLGWDASGLPAIDYFIADPYVLPESAQDYYSEKIWRMPHSYIAVDGFEVGIPTLRREDLGIPTNAIVYLSAQKGHKRYRETTKAQMKILRQVPNSYLLIKGCSDEIAIQTSFVEIAKEVGVDPDCLRFLPLDRSSEMHRANLTIADVVLDTFPYNGATTTLETLWMGIPIVTRVGEQFAARNSYTMMINSGITEGIAFTNGEYIEWGVRLGTDVNLRQQVAWKLRQSRQTSPLWNAKRFTQEMERAYEQMWDAYLNDQQG